MREMERCMCVYMYILCTCREGRDGYEEAVCEVCVLCHFFRVV